MAPSHLNDGTGLDAQTAVDVLIVGAGFAGMYMLHKMRELGLSAQVIDAAGDVGGTWYWNRYPGARCDVESLVYSYSFSPELVRDWTWSERFATQSEILEYLNFVADRLDLRKDIQFGTRVMSAHYDDASKLWHVALDSGRKIEATYCVMATGCLSEGRIPEIAGLEQFKGQWYHTGNWPHEPVDFTGQRVGVIGTGSSGIQVIPKIADMAAHTTVFQRTPSFSVPAKNAPLDPEFIGHFRAHHSEFIHSMREGTIFGSGDLDEAPEQRAYVAQSALDVDEATRTKVYAEKWNRGGSRFMACFPDQMINPHSNEAASDFIRMKIHEIVEDKEKADLLTPKGYPLGSKRICLDTGYYETFNRPDVTLVDVRDNAIVEILPDGIRTEKDSFTLDAIIFATGFDAMTGALNKIDIRGRDGRTLKDEWAAGPATYLGIAVAGFPNLFLITGPGSPSVISNVVLSIEQHVEWIADCLAQMGRSGQKHIEATQEAQADWVRHVNDVADATLFPVANSWYVGANVPGKPRVFMPYVGGVKAYRDICDSVAAEGYRGFSLS
jgi:cyclohexanone monooxygenase